MTSQSLLTSHCTRCDYSLEGLPRDAKCPECGTPIDDRFLVLRGWADSTPDLANWSPWRLLFAVLPVMYTHAIEKPLAALGLVPAHWLGQFVISALLVLLICGPVAWQR